MAKVYIKLDKEGFESLNEENKNSLPDIEYKYKMVQYQPFGEDLWYEVELVTNSQKNDFITLFDGVESEGTLSKGSVLPDGKVHGGSYVQEVNKKGEVSTKFVEKNKIKSHHIVLV